MRPIVKALLKFGVGAVLVGGVTALVAYSAGASGTVGFVDGRLRVLNMEQREQHAADSNLPAFTAIHVDTRYTDIEIREGSGYGVELFSYEDDMYSAPLRYTVENGILSVTQEARNTSHSSFFIMQNDFGTQEQNRVVIQLPKNTTLAAVELDAYSGEVELTDVRANRLAISNQYGSCAISDSSAADAVLDLYSTVVRLREFSGDTLKIINAYEGVELANTARHSFRRVELDTSSSDIELSGFDAEALTVEGSYSAVRLLDMDLVTLAMDLSSCDIRAENVTAKDAAVENTYGEFIGEGWSSGGLRAQLQSCEVDLDGALQGVTTITNTYGRVDIRTTVPQGESYFDLSTTYNQIRLGDQYAEDHLRSGKSSAANSIKVTGESCEIDIQFER